MGILALPQLARSLVAGLLEAKVKQMKASTKDRAEGKLREVEDALKEAIGAAARDRDREHEGKVEKKV